jgi:hypothetical protein
VGDEWEERAGSQDERLKDNADTQSAQGMRGEKRTNA